MTRDARDPGPIRTELQTREPRPARPADPGAPGRNILVVAIAIAMAIPIVCSGVGLGAAILRLFGVI